LAKEARMTEDVLDSSDEEEVLPWDTEPFPGWREAVESWPWCSIGYGGWEKNGKCKRCAHPITVEKGGGYTGTFDSVEAVEDLHRTAEEGPVVIEVNGGKTFFARCSCTAEHSARPPGIARGCGQWAEIDPPPDDG
jgi:hypothetical protein